MNRKILFLFFIVISALLGYGAYDAITQITGSWNISGPGNELLDQDQSYWNSGALALFTVIACFISFCALGIYLLSKGDNKLNANRRDALSGILIGLPLAALLPRFLRSGKKPILPPGATNPEEFAELCNRCYQCVHACPNKIIKIRKTGKLTELFMAQIDYSRPPDGQQAEFTIVCEEGCNECSKVCPTGAISQLTKEQKAKRQIGKAVVLHDKCIAWSKNEYCLVCDEYCPYNAFDIDKIQTGNGELGRPVVSAERCRGCNACVDACVAKERALLVIPVDNQRQLKA